MPYSTEELIQILERELHAHWQGQRCLLSSAERLSHPALAKALGPQKLSRVFAYPEFRAQVHEYQRQHQISGLVQRHCTFKGQSFEFPELHNQLIVIPGDKEKLMAAKRDVIDFWQQITQRFAGAFSGASRAQAQCQTLWLANGKRKRTTASHVQQLIEQAEWAELDGGYQELYLGLCSGNPEVCHYQWASPDSRCEQVVAVIDEIQQG
ncbi:MAG: hypothetical protein JO235_17215 [Chroococcidiopsidaceae cyanobacterium CP_BM_RX_35]|nr:hypothetical protein [Chroococcidiopsidaceae cyanobacterium CP_BM_RX_35]